MAPLSTCGHREHSGDSNVHLQKGMLICVVVVECMWVERGGT